MSDMNNDSEYETYVPEGDSPAAEEALVETRGTPAGGDRTFRMVIGALVAVFLLALTGMAVYAATVAPRNQALRRTQDAFVLVQNTATAESATQVAKAAFVAALPSNTPPPTLAATTVNKPAATATTLAFSTNLSATPPANSTVVGGGIAVAQVTASTPGKAEVPDATIQATLATGQAVTPQVGGGGPGTITPTLDPGAARTATLSVLLTQVAANQVGTPVVGAQATSTALPSTGFADEVGLPGLFGLALGLVVLIFIARTLRLSTH